MTIKLFQKIYEKLNVYLPEEWEKIVYYAYYPTDDSYDMKFYVNVDQKYKSCFDFINHYKIADLFSDIDDLIYPIRETMNDKWTIMTITVEKNGKFKTDYVYDRINETEFFKKWESQYLK